MHRPDPRLAAALDLARRGWPVLPCHSPRPSGCSCGRPACPSPGKHPRTRHGLHEASTVPAVVEGWWERWPGANVGIRTGAAPDGAGVVVVDIDPAHGGEASLTALLAVHGPLPPTVLVRTGSGGRHVYFAHPGGRVANSAGTRLGPGLDVRGDGGYVVAPPSRHPSGRHYRWLARPVLAPLPDWLASLLAPEPAPVRRPLPSARRAPGWAGAALGYEVDDVANATEGTRNAALNRAAFSLGQLVASAHLTLDEVEAALTAAGCAAGLGEAEVAATLASGLRAGLARPRHPARR